MPVAVAMGAGALSLGLIAPELNAAGLDVVLASRIMGSKHAARLEAIRDRGSISAVDLTGAALDPIPVAGFIDLGDEQGTARLRAQLTDDNCWGVVLAMRDAFDQFTDTVLSGALERTVPLVAICADNDHPAGWNALVSGSSMVRCLPTIADRICVRFPSKPMTADVVVEPYARWVIEIAPPGDAHLDAMPSVVCVSDLEPERKRKILCVNGLQLALALLAVDDGQPLLHHWIRDNRNRADQLRQEWAVGAASILAMPPTVIETFCRETLNRFEVTPDRAGRMLGLGEGQEKGDPEQLLARCSTRIDPIVRPDLPVVYEARAIAARITAEWSEMDKSEGSP